MKIQKEQEMRILFEKWQQSGKTKIAFCKQEGLIKSTFYYWIKKFQEPRLSVNKKKPAFTPLILEQNTLFNSKQPVLRINYTSGVSIDFFGTVDTGYLKDLCQ
jgi:hypothetical protein